MQRLDASERHGTLIVTRDSVDRFKGVRLPWKKRHFLRQVAKIKTAAGIDPDIKFMGQKHEGFLTPVEFTNPEFASAERKILLETAWFVGDIKIKGI